MYIGRQIAELEDIRAESIRDLNRMELDPDSKNRLTAFCVALYEATVVVLELRHSLILKCLWRFAIILGGPIILIFVVQDLWEQLMERRDRRDFRVLYYGRDASLRGSKRTWIWLGFPMIGLTTLGVQNLLSDLGSSSERGLLSLLGTGWPLLVVVGLLVAWLPLSTALEVRTATRGSPLLGEYHFSAQSIKNALHQMLRLQSITGLALIYILAILFIVPVAPKPWLNDVQTKSDKALSEVDFKWIRSEGLDHAPPVAKLLSKMNEEKLAKTLRELDNDFSVTLVGGDENRLVVFVLLLGLWLLMSTALTISWLIIVRGARMYRQGQTTR